MNTQHTQDQQPLLSEETASPSLDSSLEAAFVHPPDEARPGVYWYFMDGNRTREGMTRDLEAMKAAGEARFTPVRRKTPHLTPCIRCMSLVYYRWPQHGCAVECSQGVAM